MIGRYTIGARLSPGKGGYIKLMPGIPEGQKGG